MIWDPIRAYFDRDGVAIDSRTWAGMFENCDYKRVARTTVTDAADPSKAYDVSTVWMGIDHSFGASAPLIFETVIFGDGAGELGTDRYSTEAQARDGHAAMVVSICATLADPVVTDAVLAEGGTP